MTADVDLKALERRAYRSFFGDGIWDIYLGLLLLGMGGGPALLQMGVPLVWAGIVPLALCAAAMVFFVAGKKYITVPRLGAVQFGAARRLKRKRLSLVLACSALLGLVLFALAAWRSIPALSLGSVPMVALVFAANCLIVFSLGAYYLDFSRLYVYGLLYAVAFPLGIMLDETGRVGASFLTVYALLAGPMIVVGAALFIRFLRAYPPTSKEVNR